MPQQPPNTPPKQRRPANISSISADIRRRRDAQKRRRLALLSLRIAIVVALAGFLVWLGFRYKGDLSPDNVRSVLTFFDHSSDDQVADSGSLTGSDRSCAGAGGGLAVVTADGLTYFDDRSREIYFLAQPMSSPCVKTAGNRILAFERGGSTVISADAKNVLANEKWDDPIISADINSRGYITVLSAAEGYKASVSVRDDRLRAVYDWRSPDYYALAAATDDQGSRLAVGCIAADDAAGDCRVLIFDTGTEGVQSEAAIDSGLIVSMFWYDGNLIVMTDRAVYCLDKSGDILRKTDLPPATFKGFCADGSTLTVLLQPRDGGSRWRFLRFDSDGILTAQTDFDRDITGISSYDGTLAVNNGTSVFLYDEQLKNIKKIATKTFIYDIIMQSGYEVIVITDSAAILMK